MPFAEAYPISTAVVAAGWANPTNAYSVNNSYATTSTNLAEQSYDYNPILKGVEVIDKVFVRVKYTMAVATVLGGDNATLTFSVKVYDGSSWTTYQVTALTYACTTVNGESFTSTDGDNSNSVVAVDCTAALNTLEKLNSAQTALLAAVTSEAGVTVTLSVDCISLLVCYHTQGDVYAGAAKTRRNPNDPEPKEYRALKAVRNYLTVTS